ncbi:MAG: glycosyltransferase [Myxococcales bacterium]
MRRRFLFALVEGGGNVPPVLGLARRMAARGHHVRVLGDPAILPDARAWGLEFSPFVHAPHQNLRSLEHDRLRDWTARTSMGQLKRITQEVMFSPAHKYALDTLAEVAHFEPDVVVADYCIPGAAMAAEKAGVKCAVLVHHPYPLPAPGVPPFGLGLRPGRSLLSRLRDVVLRAFTTFFFNRLGLAPINAARSALGLERLHVVFEQMTRVPRVLVMTSPRFDFASQGALPASVRYVGPALDDPAWTEPCKLLENANASERPLVLVGLGSTFQNQKALTQRVIDALGDLPVRGLVTLGNVFQPTEFHAAPNVEVVRSAPHAALLPHARVAVAHGGHGTVIKALSEGVPVLCLPLGRDQHDNAARVTHAGAGLHLKATVSTARIRAAVARLLDEPAFRTSARELAQEIKASVAEDRCVGQLEELAS